MNSSLRERFARLGPTRAVNRVPSGSRETFVLEIGAGERFSGRIEAIFALARRGLTLLEAKRAIEELLELCQTFVVLPTVEDAASVVEDLRQAGVFALLLKPNTSRLLRLGKPSVQRRGVRTRDDATPVRYVARRDPGLENVLPIPGPRSSSQSLSEGS